MNAYFDKFAAITSRWLARPIAFCLACLSILLWAITGPYFGYSEYWQIVINTITTIVTFIMAFLILNAGERDAKSIQLKLDELIRVTDARNEFIAIEVKTAIDGLEKRKAQMIEETDGR